jgi:hypothetical protein
MKSFECEYCLESFKNNIMLTKHQTTAKYCMTYKNVLFSCKKCNYSTVGIKNIEKHITEDNCICSVNNEDINDYIIDDKSLDSYTSEHESIITKLKTSLQVERIKNNIYKSIIEQNIPIKLDTLMKQEGDTFNIYEQNLNNIGICIHKNEKEDIIITTENKLIKKNSRPQSPIKETKDLDLDRDKEEDDDDKNTKSFKSYKIVKSHIELSPERTKEEIDSKIREVDMNIYNIRRSFGDLDKSKMIFKENLENVKNTKTYMKHLDVIKKTRKNLVGTLTFTDYTILLETHIKILEEILTEKGHNAKKITSTISKSLSSLDSRLLMYGNYYDIPIDIEELSNFRTCLDLSVKSYTYYIPFNVTEKLKLFFNYGTVLTSIKNCIETYIINKYDFNNVVYVPLKNSSEEDPYSFYILENIAKEKRYWKMDCRLVELSENIINNVRPYLINIFKKMYQDIFNDNDYRENYNSKTEITSSDFEQLLQNIFTLSDTLKFYNIVRNIIKEKATYYPTENDKFNIISDDLILKKKFSNTKERIDKADIVKLLFDNITNEQAVDLYRGLCCN